MMLPNCCAYFAVLYILVRINIIQCLFTYWLRFNHLLLSVGGCSKSSKLKLFCDQMFNW